MSTETTAAALRDTLLLQFFEYPEEIKSVNGKIQFKHRIQREYPETLYGDRFNNTGVITNLQFYTEHITAWHAAISKHYSFYMKRGICKGRQIQIFEDEDKCQERRILTINFDQNGTVVLQGNEAALRSFVQSFPSLKKTAASKRNTGSTTSSPITTRTTTVDSQVHGTDQSLPMPNHNNHHPDQHTINLLRDRLAMLEVELTELREQLPASTTPHPYIQEQLSQYKHQFRLQHKS